MKKRRFVRLIVVTALMVSLVGCGSVGARCQKTDDLYLSVDEYETLIAIDRAVGGEIVEDEQGVCKPCAWESVRCAGGRVSQIALSNLAISEVPDEVFELTGLRYLYLDRNQLAELPPEIGQLTALRRLYLNENQLTELPSEIGLLSNLEVLDLSGNQLAELPAEIGQLASLETLAASQNRLTALPEEVSQLSNLSYLDLWDNQLTVLPSEIGQLSNLTRLDIRDNRITELSADIGQLNLSFLHFAGNPITEIPPGLCQMPDLFLDPDDLCPDVVDQGQ
ncbi:MAG: leucine-rich repeat domain-containing protein [Anaerolineae bacterium]|nr:leucine-rich repeat domain-containing protein [Anaerolineae bacterium]